MSYIIGAVAKPLGVLLFYIYDIIGNYALSIVLITIIVKLAIYPLYLKQAKSMAKMTTIQPKLKQIQQKYAKDREMMSIKLSELYKEEGVNPASGCLPMLIQMPIIFALYALLRNPLIYINKTEILFAIHESFLWILDLSQPDKWILPIAAGIATYISTSISFNNQPDTPGMGSSMKLMKYLFPVMIVLMGRSFPSGLALYWFVGQIMQIFFNIHLNKVKKSLAGDTKKSKKK